MAKQCQTASSSSGEIDLNATRASLLLRLRSQGDSAAWNQAWEDLFSTYSLPIWNYLRGHMAIAESECDALVQDVMLAVLRGLPAFQHQPGRRSFRGWLFMIARNRGLDFLRRASRDAARVTEVADRDSASLNDILADPNALQPDDAWDLEWKTNLRNRALEKLRQTANAQKLAVYIFKVIEGHTVKETLIAFPEVSATDVYMAQYRVGKLLKKMIRNLELGPIVPTTSQAPRPRSGAK